MTRRAPVLAVVAALVVAAVGAPLAVAGAHYGPAASDGPENASDAPGARLAGVLGSQGADLSGDLQRRSFDVALSRANDSAARAAVVARSADAMDERLAQLNETKATLRARHENGSISRAEYRARLARLASRTAALRSLADQSTAAARDLPDAALRAHGVEVDRLRQLRQAAGNLTGPEVAAIARNVTGGPPARAPGAANGNGPGAPAANATDRGPSGETPGAGNGNGRGAPDGATNRPDAADRTTGPANAAGNATNAAGGADRATGAMNATNRSDAANRTTGPTNAADRSNATDRATGATNGTVNVANGTVGVTNATRGGSGAPTTAPSAGGRSTSANRTAAGGAGNATAGADRATAAR